MKKILVEFNDPSTYAFETWLYENAADWKWKFTPRPDCMDSEITGIYLPPGDAVAFKLKFGL